MKKTFYKAPKGGAFIWFVVGITAFLTGGLGLLLLDAITCDFNVVFSSGCGTVSTSGGNPPAAGGICTSAPNSCDMRNNGFIVSATGEDGNGSYLVCNATIPSESECSPPTINTGEFYAKPSLVGPNKSTTLYWDLSEATATTVCTVTGDNGFTSSGTGTGSVATGVLAQTTMFTLSCHNGGGTSSTASIRVIVDPKYKEI